MHKSDKIIIKMFQGYCKFFNVKPREMMIDWMKQWMDFMTSKTGHLDVHDDICTLGDIRERAESEFFGDGSAHRAVSRWLNVYFK